MNDRHLLDGIISPESYHLSGVSQGVENDIAGTVKPAVGLVSSGVESGDTSTKHWYTLYFHIDLLL